MQNFYTYPDELTGKELIDAIKREEPDVPVVSHSQLQSWDRCEFKWWLSYDQGWKPRETKEYLTLGRLGHELMACWYGTHSREQIVKLLGDHFNKYAMQGDWHLPMLAEESWLMLRYIDDFTPAEDRDLGDILAVEEHFVIALWTPLGSKYYLQGYVDMRNLDINGTPWIWDHKWTKKFWFPNEVLMDPQLPLYAAALSQVGVDVEGVVINQLNTYEFKKKEQVSPEKLFKRDYHFVTPSQKVSILREVGNAVDDMLEKKQSGAPARRRLARGCSMCGFMGPCLMSMRGYDLVSLLSPDFKRDDEPEETYLDDSLEGVEFDDF